jgi:hypothetical protein
MRISKIPLINRVLGTDIPRGFGGTIPFKGHTVLTAQKRVLSEQGKKTLLQRLVGVPERYHIQALKEMGLKEPGLWIPSGKLTVIRDKCVTTAFVDFIVDQLQTETSVFGDFKYHHSGEGTGAEDAGDTALGTPREDARDVGTQTENAHNIYESVATTTYTNTWAITEHGLFNTAGAGGPPVTGGTLMDRTKFAAINVVNTNQIQWTFDISFVAGG